jgi:hypothetical protein
MEPAAGRAALFEHRPAAGLCRLRLHARHDAPRIAKAVSTALAQAGARGLILRGARTVLTPEPADHLFVIDGRAPRPPVPSAQPLLSRRAGHTHAAMRAGKPQVVVPFMVRPALARPAVL